MRLQTRSGWGGNAEKRAAQYGATTRSIDAILVDTSISAVLIATSTDTHSDLTKHATAAGKAVLCCAKSPLIEA